MEKSVNITKQDRLDIINKLRRAAYKSAKAQNKEANFLEDLTRSIINRLASNMDDHITGPSANYLNVCESTYGFHNDISNLSMVDSEGEKVHIKSLVTSLPSYSNHITEQSSCLYNFNRGETKENVVPKNLMINGYIAWPLPMGSKRTIELSDEELQKVNDHNSHVESKYGAIENTLIEAIKAIESCRTTKAFKAKHLPEHLLPQTVLDKLAEANKDTEEDEQNANLANKMSALIATAKMIGD